MLDMVIEQIVLLKPTIITSAVGTIIVLLMILLFSRKFSWRANNVGLIGLFYDSTYFETILMSVCLIKLFLVISMMITGTRLSMVHIVFYGTLVLIYSIMRHSIKEILISLFNGIIIIGVLYISMFLLSYLREVLFDVKIVIAMVLLSVFLVMYSLYDLMWSILNIVSSRPMSYTPKDVSFDYLSTSTPEYVDMDQIKETISELLPEEEEVEPIEEYLGTNDSDISEQLEELSMTKEEWKEMIANEATTGVEASDVELDIIDLNNEEEES